LDSKILLGIIAVTIFGTMGVQHIFVQAGLSPIETIQVKGEFVTDSERGGETVISEAECPPSHPFLIGGSYHFQLVPFAGSNILPIYSVTPIFDPINNIYSVQTSVISEQTQTGIQARALCANFNFPMDMGMVGGGLLDINTISLLVGAIGTNPVITGLVAVSIP